MSLRVFENSDFKTRIHRSHTPTLILSKILKFFKFFASFGNRIWSLQAELVWSPHSPDLAPLDFFFWGAAKAEVYK